MLKFALFYSFLMVFFLFFCTKLAQMSCFVHRFKSDSFWYKKKLWFSGLFYFFKDLFQHLPFLVVKDMCIFKRLALLRISFVILRFSIFFKIHMAVVCRNVWKLKYGNLERDKMKTYSFFCFSWNDNRFSLSASWFVSGIKRFKRYFNERSFQNDA